MQKLKESPIEYYGYKFYENGKVYDAVGREIIPNIDKYGNRSILLIIPDSESPKGVRKRRIYLARTMYNLFYGVELPRNMIICYKDGNKGNYGIKNLEATRKTSSFQKRVLSKEQVEEIQKLYSNKDKHFHSQWKKRKDDYSIRDLAKKYGVSVYTIQRVIGGTYNCSGTIENVGKEN